MTPRILIHSRAGRRRSLTTAGLIAMMFCTCGGCMQTVSRTTNDSRPLPGKPRAVQAAPAGTTAEKIVLQVAAKPRDTNANGFPDQIDLIANLFSDDHPMPIYEDGAFVFSLFVGGQADVPGAQPLREWRIEGERLEKAKVGRTLYGLTYSFALSFLDTGGDRFPLMAADLTARFEPADGREPIVRREIHKMQIGSPVASQQ